MLDDQLAYFGATLLLLPLLCLITMAHHACGHFADFERRVSGPFDADCLHTCSRYMQVLSLM